eukprot:583333-Pelagomonas_calceolata.AAC.1
MSRRASCQTLKPGLCCGSAARQPAVVHSVVDARGSTVMINSGCCTVVRSLVVVQEGGLQKCSAVDAQGSTLMTTVVDAQCCGCAGGWSAVVHGVSMARECLGTAGYSGAQEQLDPGAFDKA